MCFAKVINPQLCEIELFVIIYEINYRTAELNPIIAILMGREPFFNEKGASVDTETPLRYPEPGSNRHGLLHWCLRPARLPIPPSGHSALLLAVPCGTAFLLCMGSFAIGGQSRHNFRIKRERLEIDLPVKDAKVSVFSENHKFSYLCKIYK